MTNNIHKNAKNREAFGVVKFYIFLTPRAPWENERMPKVHRRAGKSMCSPGKDETGGIVHKKRQKIHLRLEDVTIEIMHRLLYNPDIVIKNT